MGILSAFNANVNKSVTDIVNETILGFDAKNASSCIAEQKAKINQNIDGSIIKVAGDFLIEQEAQIVLSCIQEQKNASELMNELAAKVSEKLNTVRDDLASFGNVSLNLSKTEVDNIVSQHLSVENNTQCVVKIDQNVQQKIKDSDLTVGLSNQTLQEAKELCSELSTQILSTAGNPNVKSSVIDAASDRADEACRAYNIALTSAKGNFLVKQGVSAEGDCQQAQKIATEITNKLGAQVDKILKNETKGFGSIVQYLIIGAVVLGVIAIILAVVKMMSSKKKKKQQEQYQQFQQSRRSSRNYPSDRYDDRRNSQRKRIVVRMV